MNIGLYDTSAVYDIVRSFGNMELPSGSNILDNFDENRKERRDD